MDYVTLIISAFIRPTAMIFSLFRKVLQATELIPTIANCVTLTRDLESGGHVMDYVTLVISACIRPTAMIFSLFRKVFWLTEFIPTIANCVTLTRDLEFEGHVMDYSTR